MLPTLAQLESIQPGQVFIYRTGKIIKKPDELSRKAHEMYVRGLATLCQRNIFPGAEFSHCEYYIIGIKPKHNYLKSEKPKRPYVTGPRKIPENVKRRD